MNAASLPFSLPRSLCWVTLAAALAACGGSTNPTPDGGPGSEDAGTQEVLGSDGGVVSDGGTADAEVGDGVRRDAVVVAGIPVDRYTWTDSKGRPRTASLKRQGASNGGYAVQLTYEVPEGAGWRTVTLQGTGGGEQGFGYFVAHERYRTFDDGSSGTIAALHGEDDSPLGLGFPVTASHSAIGAGSTSATHTFATTYPKWGTAAAMNDVDAMTPKAGAAHQKFTLPLAIQWTFQKGTDFPRIDIKLDLSAASAGQLAFDVRGPYGVLEFADGDTSAALNNVQWGDSAFHFSTQAAANTYLSTSAGWDWSEAVGSVRPYHGLLARHSNTGVLYELGLFELKLASDAGLVYSGYADNRGRSKAGTGHGLLSVAFSEGEWPFQSAQYSGVNAAAPATGKKFAWGSSSLYGSRGDTQYLTPTVSVPIVSYPASKALLYRTCLVLGVSTFSDANPKGLTRTVAESASPSCATASPMN